MFYPTVEQSGQLLFLKSRQQRRSSPQSFWKYNTHSKSEFERRHLKTICCSLQLTQKIQDHKLSASVCFKYSKGKSHMRTQPIQNKQVSGANQIITLSRGHYTLNCCVGIQKKKVTVLQSSSTTILFGENWQTFRGKARVKG